METVYRDYSSKGVKFFYLYKKLAHPGFNDYIDPLTIEERLLHLKVAQKKLATDFTWICDTMNNDVRDALGGLPNSEIVIDPEGKIVRARAWSNAETLRSDLEELIGKVEKVTQISDLSSEQQELGFDPEIARGVVEPLQIDARLENIKTVPILNEDPFFTKLHAQANADLLENGSGKLYFAFHLDPIYDVHWNNLVEPIQYELTASNNATITPAKGSGPKVNEDADQDPREFLVEVKDASTDTEITVTVKYFACSDEWCKPFTQSYTISLQRDPSNQLFRPRPNRR